MDFKKLQATVGHFSDTGQNSADLNRVRTKIFDSVDEGSISTTDRDKLIKQLYAAASSKGIFFMRVTERTKPEPVKEEEPEDDESYEESYEESYDEEDE